MGPDGHTASLFPGSPALDEQRRRVVPRDGTKPPPRRLTITPPVIAAARRIAVLVAGADKAPAVARGLQGRFRRRTCRCSWRCGGRGFSTAPPPPSCGGTPREGAGGRHRRHQRPARRGGGGRARHPDRPRAPLPHARHARASRPIVRRYLAEAGTTPERACFGIAGPVVDGECRTPNLPWMVSTAGLAAEIGIRATTDHQRFRGGRLRPPAPAARPTW